MLRPVGVFGIHIIGLDALHDFVSAAALHQSDTPPPSGAFTRWPRHLRFWPSILGRLPSPRPSLSCLLASSLSAVRSGHLSMATLRTAAVKICHQVADNAELQTALHHPRLHQDPRPQLLCPTGARPALPKGARSITPPAVSLAKGFLTWLAAVQRQRVPA